MIKQVFCIFFEFILKTLILVFIFFSMAYLVFTATADAKAVRGYKHYRHIPKVRKKNRIADNVIVGGIITHIAFKSLKPKNHISVNE
jgi:hypothetical protein